MNITRNIRTPIMHRAVEANGFVFVGGTIADDTSVSMGEQTRNILGKIAGYLKEAGTDSSRVVSASIFVTDLSKKKEMDAAWTEFFGDNLPIGHPRTGAHIDLAAVERDRSVRCNDEVGIHGIGAKTFSGGGILPRPRPTSRRPWTPTRRARPPRSTSATPTTRSPSPPAG